MGRIATAVVVWLTIAALAQTPTIDVNPGMWELTFALDKTWVATGLVCFSRTKGRTNLSVVHESYLTCSQKTLKESPTSLDITESCRDPGGVTAFAFHFDRQSPTSLEGRIQNGREQATVAGRWVGEACDLSEALSSRPVAMVSGLRFGLIVPHESAAFGEGAVKPGNGCTNPVPIRRTEPKYTGPALRAKRQGKVMLEAVVGSDGAIGDVRVIKSLDAQDGLDFEAVRALKEWQFTPARCQGASTPMILQIEFEFHVH